MENKKRSHTEKQRSVKEARSHMNQTSATALVRKVSSAPSHMGNAGAAMAPLRWLRWRVLQLTATGRNALCSAVRGALLHDVMFRTV